MIFNILISVLTVFVLVCLIAFLDRQIRPFWGEKLSFSKSILLLFSVLSGIYQLAFIFHLLILFTIVDLLAFGICLTFWKTILSQLKDYWHTIRGLPCQHGKVPVSILYLFVFYLFFLSIFSVPGWEWDGMTFHISRAFLYLNEGTVFTTNYSDPRQVVWPMGGDLLLYIFSRSGQTIGVGFIAYIFFIGILVTIYEVVSRQVNKKTALTLTFVAASMPILIYCSTSIKGDMLAIFAFILMWFCLKEFHEHRHYSDLYLAILAFAFGSTAKLTFVFVAPFSLIAFILMELLDKKSWRLEGSNLSWKMLIPFLALTLILLQPHLYLHNFLTFDHLIGPTSKLIHPMAPITMLQNFFKYHLELIDFVLPFSSVGFPFIDTALSFLYNATVGKWTHDLPWHFHYFPQEMNASFGPFGFLLVFLIYYACFGRSKLAERLYAFTAFASIVFITLKFPRDENISIVRYFAPAFIGSLAFLPRIGQNKILNYHSAVRYLCLILLLICNVINYAKPLVSYHPKAIPWYRYAFTNRDFLYKEKHFFDDRIEIYREEIRPHDNVLIISKPNVWMYPYYQQAPTARIRLKNFDLLSEKWLKENLTDYTLIICEHKDCIAELDSYPELKRFWRSSIGIPRQAAYYRKTSNIK